MPLCNSPLTVSAAIFGAVAFIAMDGRNRIHPHTSGIENTELDHYHLSKPTTGTFEKCLQVIYCFASIQHPLFPGTQRVLENVTSLNRFFAL